MKTYVKYFNEIILSDLPKVGGKNASLGEMFQNLSDKGIAVPNGFALTADAYWKFIEHNNLKDRLTKVLSTLDTTNFSNLNKIGNDCREIIMSGEMPEEICKKINDGYEYLINEYGEDISFAARSSATAEDLAYCKFCWTAGNLSKCKGVGKFNKSLAIVVMLHSLPIGLLNIEMIMVLIT